MQVHRADAPEECENSIRVGLEPDQLSHQAVYSTRDHTADDGLCPKADTCRLFMLRGSTINGSALLSQSRVLLIATLHATNAQNCASCIVSGHKAENAERSVKWAEIAGSVDTIVVLMGVGELKSITGQLVEGGLKPDTPVALIEWGTLEKQRIITGKIGTIADEAAKRNVKPPSVVVIGEVVNLGRKLSWFKKTRR